MKRGFGLLLLGMFMFSCFLISQGQITFAVSLFGFTIFIYLLSEAQSTVTKINKRNQTFSEKQSQIRLLWNEKLLESAQILNPKASSLTQEQQLEIVINDAIKPNLDSFRKLIELIDLRSKLPFDKLQTQSANGILRILSRKGLRGILRFKYLEDLSKRYARDRDVFSEEDANELEELKNLYNSSDETTRIVCDLLWSIKYLSVYEYKDTVENAISNDLLTGKVPIETKRVMFYDRYLK